MSKKLVAPGITEGEWLFDDNEGYGTCNIWAGCSPTGAGKCGPLIAQMVGDSAEADANARFLAGSKRVAEAAAAFLEVGGSDLARALACSDRFDRTCDDLRTALLDSGYREEETK